MKLIGANHATGLLVLGVYLSFILLYIYLLSADIFAPKILDCRDVEMLCEHKEKGALVG